MERKRIDYSISAVNLTNSEQLEEMLNALNEAQVKKVGIQKQIENLTPASLLKELAAIDLDIMSINRDIKLTIDQVGSFQNLARGWYAVKQRKVSVYYDVAKTQANLLKQYADMVIVQSVDPEKMNGLVKGGFISHDDAVMCADTKESFAYIIKVDLSPEAK